MSCKVKIHEEVTDPRPSGWVLCFQQCTYHYDDGPAQNGYRFIWRRPNGNLQAARGQARIPDADSLRNLTDQAKEKGWF